MTVTDVKTGRRKDADGHSIYTIDVTLSDGTTRSSDYYDILDYWEDLGYINETNELPEDF